MVVGHAEFYYMIKTQDNRRVYVVYSDYNFGGQNNNKQNMFLFLL